MSKKKFIKMAGVTSEEQFYKLFPTEEAFFNAYPEARQMAKGGDTGTFSGGVYFPDGGTYDMSYDDIAQAIGVLPQFAMGSMMYATGGDLPSEDMIPNEKIKTKKEKVSFPFFNPYAYYKEVNKNPKEFMSGLQKLAKPIEQPAQEQPSFKHGGLHKYQIAGSYPPLQSAQNPPYDPSDPLGVRRMFRMNNQSGSTSINQNTQGTTAAAGQANQNLSVPDPNYITMGGGLLGLPQISVNPDAVATNKKPKTTSTAAKKLFDPSKAARRSANFQRGLGLVSGAVNFVDDILSRDRMKRWDYNQQQAENIYPVVPQGVSGSRGDYVVNTGAFRPDEYTVNKGMYTDQNPGLFLGQVGGIIPEDLGDVAMSPVMLPEMLRTPAPAEEPSSKPSGDFNTKGQGIAVSHNNPGNIHYGKYTSQWGAEKGASDNQGNVAIFKSIEDGLDAMKKLLFGPAYKNLTIVEARNKWVTGKPTNTTESSLNIAKALGGNRKITDLDDQEKMKLLLEFVKYEDRRMYNKLKDMNLTGMQNGGTMIANKMIEYEEGGVYEMTEDELNQFLAMGGNIEFM